MKQALLLAFCLFAFGQSASAQLEKILHQAFELNEVSSVSLNLHGEYEFEKWAGNAILVETHVQLYDASPSIFKHVLNHGRYMLKAKKEEQRIHIESKDLERKTIHKNGNQCYEFVKVRILIPEDFEIVDQQNLRKIVPIDDPTSSTQKDK